MDEEKEYSDTKMNNDVFSVSELGGKQICLKNGLPVYGGTHDKISGIRKIGGLEVLLAEDNDKSAFWTLDGKKLYPLPKNSDLVGFLGDFAYVEQSRFLRGKKTLLVSKTGDVVYSAGKEWDGLYVTDVFQYADRTSILLNDEFEMSYNKPLPPKYSRDIKLSMNQFNIAVEKYRKFNEARTLIPLLGMAVAAMWLGVYDGPQNLAERIGLAAAVMGVIGGGLFGIYAPFNPGKPKPNYNAAASRLLTDE